MKEKVQKIRDEITELRSQMDERFKLIDALYASCKHNWTEPVMQMKKVEYTGTLMGSYDHREWQRECKVCGKLETTQKENMISVPDFGSDYGKITVPHFNWNMALKH